MNESDTSRSLQFLHFKYSTLEKATDRFDIAHKLGNGGYSEVFKVCVLSIFYV
jgi:hypothetical protein